MDIAFTFSLQPQPWRILSRFLSGILVLVCAGVPSWANAQGTPAPVTPQNSMRVEAPDPHKLELAGRYLKARSDLSTLPSMKVSSVTIPDEVAREQFVDEVMAALSHSKLWNPEYKNWGTVRKIVLDGYNQWVNYVITAQKNGPQQSQLDDAFKLAFMNKISTADMQQIVDFYETPVGSKFVTIHTLFLAELTIAAGNLRTEKENIKELALNPGPETGRFNTLMQLGYENVIPIYDQGPDGNQRASEVGSEIMAGTVRSDFTRLEEIWNQLPADAQAQVVTYQTSPVWKMEQVALARGIQATTERSGALALGGSLAAILLKSTGKISPLLPH